jgi:hypothetical protein
MERWKKTSTSPGSPGTSNRTGGDGASARRRELCPAAARFSVRAGRVVVDPGVNDDAAVAVVSKEQPILTTRSRVRACFAFCNALRCNALQMENHMALAADRMKAMRERRRTRGLRELRLIVPDARSKAVRRRIAKEVAGLDQSRELDALGWIEAVSEFDAR